MIVFGDSQGSQTETLRFDPFSLDVKKWYLENQDKLKKFDTCNWSNYFSFDFNFFFVVLKFNS